MNTLAITFATILGAANLIAVDQGPTAMSLPPQFHFDLTFADLHVFRGVNPVAPGESWRVHFVQRDSMTPPTFDLGARYVFAVDFDRGTPVLTVLAKEGSPEAAYIVAAAAGAPGWSAGCPFEVAREYEALPAGVALTLRGTADETPAVPAGQDWRNNPDGDGELILVVENRNTEAVEVPIYGDNVADWLLVAIDGHVSALAGQSPAPLAHKLTLAAGERREFRFNIFTMKNDYQNWPQGGYRVNVHAVLGGTTANLEFYYYTSHHEALRLAARKAAGLE